LPVDQVLKREAMCITTLRAELDHFTPAVCVWGAILVLLRWLGKHLKAVPSF